MSKLRLVFIKEAQASYISHLDLMRTFQRVFPRTELHLKHSNGFHPHPIISIVLPLPVGQSSECELLDFETVEDSDGSGVAEKLNTGMPAGIRVLDCYEANRPVRDLTYLRATMEFLYDNGVPAGAVDELNALFAREELVIEKRTKHKSLAEINIAPLIKSVSFAEGENVVTAEVVVAAQNPGLNPAFLAQAVERQLPALVPDFVRVRRKELFDAQMEIFR
ncbi:MAG: TIGR03936 family radical SAM-associated protein [Oscillospiraceae bacterium]|nr:TIGR03936 family radical SAM-associated protein [Oscillospiraceae bacterium]